MISRMPGVLPQDTCRGTAAAGATGLLHRTLARLRASSGQPSQAEDCACMMVQSVSQSASQPSVRPPAGFRRKGSRNKQSGTAGAMSRG